ncbi:MAG: hypothetical protein MI685_05875 [Chlorobiales bacterium]|nr:hypothetical protein [Chlorobiales bacterium]
MNCSEERLKSIGIGAICILASTTVPYLVLINIFLLSGIIIGGAVAAYSYIIKCQTRLTISEAFVFSSLAGIAGSAVTVAAHYFLITFFQYRPGKEEFTALLEWMRGVSPEDDMLITQYQEMLQAPVEISFPVFFVNIFVTAVFYAPVAGLGGICTVWWLKSQARKGG